jgi:hypothetical protein
LLKPLDALAKCRQPLGRATAYVVEASEVLDGDEADRVGNIERLPRRSTLTPAAAAIALR